jgi:glyoxylase-like metal-dependent hydrolase (beta-lactamase superfamily II)
MYEIYAIRYATFAERSSHENFIQKDMHHGSMPLDYFVWLIRSGDRDILVDTGFNQAAGGRRNRTLKIPTEVALERLGIDPRSINDVIVTHLHYDHSGNLDKFPNARFHVQEREMTYATGRCMCHGYLRHPFDVDPVIQMVRYLYADRLVFHCGYSTMAPGIDLHWVGGHSDGLQIVRVQTRRGSVVLASDAAHFYENMKRQNPFPLVYNVGDMIQGWRTIANLAEDQTCIIPGHDPAVAELFQRMPSTEVDAYALHEAPNNAAWKSFAASSANLSS